MDAASIAASALVYSVASQPSGQVQVDAGGLDRAVPGLGLHRLDGHPGLPQPGQAGVAQLMAGQVINPGPPAGAADDLVDCLGDQGLLTLQPDNALRADLALFTLLTLRPAPTLLTGGADDPALPLSAAQTRLTLHAALAALAALARQPPARLPRRAGPYWR